MQQVTLREERVSRNGMYTVKEMLKGIVTLREERVSRNLFKPKSKKYKK